MKHIIIILAMFIASCTTSRNAHSTVTREVVTGVGHTADGRYITLEGRKGRFPVISDTLKVNDTITVTWLRRISSK